MRYAYVTRPAGIGEWIYEGVFTRFKERKQKQIWYIFCEGRAVYCFGYFYPYSLSVWSRRLAASYWQRLLKIKLL